MIKKSVVMSIGLSSVALAMGATDVYAAEKGTVTTDVLNVRSGPSTNHSVIGKLYRGNTVEILQSSNGWHQVRLSNGSTGWSSGDYISKGSSNNQGSLGYGVVNTATLNVRSGAGTNYSIIGKIHKNDKVELLSSSNGWYKIKLSNGSTGWSSGDYINKTSSNDQDSSNNQGSTGNSSLGYGIVTTDVLNVRNGASTSYSVIGKLYKNNKVELLGSSNRWYKVKLSNGNIGWSSADYITKSSSGNQDSSNDQGSTSNPSTSKQNAVVNLALSQIGKPYVWGAEGPNSFDCSGLVYYVYKNAAGVNLPRTSREQSTVGTTVNKSQLQPGDLIFSSTDGSGNVSHVGIYIGNNEMIHAPQPGENVQKANINTSYWNKTYLWSKRVL